MTFSRDPGVVTPDVDMMMASREAAVDYMTPVGLHHMMARGHHYGPGPWVDGGPRADWTSVYYHRADRDGIGCRFNHIITLLGKNLFNRFEEFHVIHRRFWSICR